MVTPRLNPIRGLVAGVRGVDGLSVDERRGSGAQAIKATPPIFISAGLY